MSARWTAGEVVDNRPNPNPERRPPNPMFALLLSLLLSVAPSMTQATPRILQIHRETVRPGSEAAFRRVEREIALTCARLGCPHPYLSLESLTGQPEIWFLNGYASEAERKTVADGYAKSATLMSALGKLGSEKAALIDTSIEVLAEYTPGSGRGPSWVLGQGRFLVVLIAKGESRAQGTVFEAPDGTRFTFEPFRTRGDADAAATHAGQDARVLAVRPEWSLPDTSWIARDPELWGAAGRK